MGTARPRTMKWAVLGLMAACAASPAAAHADADAGATRWTAAASAVLRKDLDTLRAQLEWRDWPWCLEWAQGRTKYKKSACASAVDVNRISPITGDALLHMAAGHRADARIVGLLLEHGADLEMKNRDGDTPLQLAAKYGHVQVCARLLRRCADVRAANGAGLTAMQTAQASGQWANLEAPWMDAARSHGRTCGSSWAAALWADLGGEQTSTWGAFQPFPNPVHSSCGSRGDQGRPLELVCSATNQLPTEVLYAIEEELQKEEGMPHFGHGAHCDGLSVPPRIAIAILDNFRDFGAVNERARREFAELVLADWRGEETCGVAVLLMLSVDGAFGGTDSGGRWFELVGMEVDENSAAFKQLQKSVSGVTFSFLRLLSEEYGTFIERNNALIEKGSPCRSLRSRKFARPASIARRLRASLGTSTRSSR
eukprot:SAG31_NODE_4818_length_2933_cov_2.232886_1_plen_426_part_00